MQPIQLNVFSEIGPLQAVLTHAPGAEVEGMAPSSMSDMLFDDIIHGPEARAEHAVFQAVMHRFGVEVLDIRDLLLAALDEADDDARAALIDQVASLDRVSPRVQRLLLEMSPAELGEALISGIRAEDHGVVEPRQFRLAPLPNLLFVRDPHVVLGDRVVISAMKRPARAREPALSRFVFAHHPRLRANRVLVDFGQQNSLPARSWSGYTSLEGGDVLVFSEGVVLVGISERTVETAADVLADRLRGHDRLHTLVMVPMPPNRSQMHLDTILTRVSEHECLVYPAMIPAPGAQASETLSALRVDLARSNGVNWGMRYPSLLTCLRDCGVELEPIFCGGDDPVQQAREQWTDGANCFTLAPGVMVMYDRNTYTAAELERRGYELVRTGAMTIEQIAAMNLIEGRKYALMLPSGELSRARGGPRCLTMPLARG